MTSKEAYGIIINNVPNADAVKCFEYDTIFVFQLASKNRAMKDDETGKILDCLRSVNKETKEVRDFKPFYIPLEEYKNGKEVKDFK